MSDTPKPEIPLPWKRDFNSIYILEDGYPRYIDIDGMMHINDAKYIVHACNSLPALEARVKELQTALIRIRDIAKNNYGRQNEKLADIAPLATAALALSKEACDE